MGIAPEIQINPSDIESFKNINSPEELRLKIESIHEKTKQIASVLEAKRDALQSEYDKGVKELVSRETEAQEKQVEVLKFMKKSGFDLFPKEMTDKIIAMLKNNTLTIP